MYFAGGVISELEIVSCFRNADANLVNVTNCSPINYPYVRELRIVASSPVMIFNT